MIIMIIIALTPHSLFSVNTLITIAIAISILITIWKIYYRITHYITCRTYKCMYEEYIHDHDNYDMNDSSSTHSLTTEYAKCFLAAISPSMAMIHTVGIWNSILFMVCYIIKAATYITPIEEQTTENRRKAYVPKHKRWHRTALLISKVSNIFDAVITAITPSDTSPRINRQHFYYSQRRTRRRDGKTITAMAAMLMIASTEASASIHQSAQFDTDSKPIGIDNRCSACISHEITDFIGPLKDSNRIIKGFGGIRHSSNIMMGTLKWKWCDDQGKVHKHVIPNSYYVPKGKTRLLSPQHWAKEQRGKAKLTTGEFTNSKQSTLQWGQGGKYKLTVPLSSSTNVATLYMAPGYRNYDIYCKEAKISTTKEDQDPTTITSSIDEKEENTKYKIAFDPTSH